MRKIQIFFLLLISTALHAQSWKLTGNNGTDPSLNFVGTKNMVPLVFRVNNQTSGYITPDLSKANISFGYQALNINGGLYNAAVGYQSLFANSSGSYNTANGFRALYTNTTGFRNTAIGYEALKSNTTGGYNTATGVGSLSYNTTGAFNTASGLFSLGLNTTGMENTAMGSNALESNTTGSYNSANGRFALRNNIDGINNAAVGYSALYSNTSGGENTATGYASMYSNTDGLANTANGYKALYNNTGGDFNTALGYKSMDSNTIGSYNTAIGASALYGANNAGKFNTACGYAVLKNNTSGNGNSGAGSYALASNKTGFSNTAHGYYALYNNISGQGNTAVGDSALYSNTIGSGNSSVGLKTLYSNVTGNRNTASGDSALYTNKSGHNNTANGYGALYNNTGNENTALGGYALYKNTNGANNTAIGINALYENTNGSQNVAVGWKAGIVGNYNNTVCLGYNAAASASDQVRIGNPITSSIGGWTGWTDVSDGRVKKNIKQNVPGLAFINKLTPVTYNLDLGAADKILQHKNSEGKNDAADAVSNQEAQSRQVKQQTNYTGFIAQDVERAAKELQYDFSGVDVAKNDHDLYGLRYASFVVPLVKAVQELDQNQQDAVKALQKENIELKQRLEKLEAIILGAASNTQQTASINAALLEQNIPNPFKNSTTIGYLLPQQYKTAAIIITGSNGSVLKTIHLSGSGKGSVQISQASLSKGSYNYSLYVDERLINTKQMILAW